MKVEWEGECLSEDDLWNLFSDHPNEASDTIQFYSRLKPLFAKMKLTDDSRMYHVYRHSTLREPPDGARLRATVTQRNLWRVAGVIAGRGNNDAAIQYLGPR